jgi:hypothetical protein
LGANFCSSITYDLSFIQATVVNIYLINVDHIRRLKCH